MKVIFLDVDGVLNSVHKLEFEYRVLGKRKLSGPNFPYDEDACAYLKYILDSSDAYVILTSSKRKYIDDLNTVISKFQEYDILDRLLDLLPNDMNKEEGIKYMLNKYDIDNYIAVDDDELNVEFLHKTNRMTGLTLSDANIVIKKMNRM